MNQLARSIALTTQQQCASIELRSLAEGYIEEHLVECCIELRAQRLSNDLAQGRMAELRSLLGSDDIYAAQRLVEAMAADFIARTLGEQG